MKVFALGALVGCGGLVAAPTSDAASDVAADTADGADAGSLSACAHACVVATAGDCPALLLYDCLQPKCGSNASTAICEAIDGTPAPAATIECVKTAFPTCPTTACQGSKTCDAFIACIEGCGG